MRVPILHQGDGFVAVAKPSGLIVHRNDFSRRDEGQDFVIGTLLGTEENGVVTISSSFPVPHTEVEDQIALNTDFHGTMLALQQRVLPKQTVVGWYSTGESVTENTTLFHQFYGQDVERPVHLLLDLGLNERRMSCKAYVSAGLSLGQERLGTVFRDIRLSVLNGDSDRVGIDNLVKMTSASQEAGSAAGSSSSSADAYESVEITVKKLLGTLDGVVEYVDKVVKGSQTAEPETVRLLQQVCARAPYCARAARLVAESRRPRAPFRLHPLFIDLSISFSIIPLF